MAFCVRFEGEKTVWCMNTIEETLKLFEGCYAIDEKKTMGSQTGCWCIQVALVLALFVDEDPPPDLLGFLLRSDW